MEQAAAFIRGVVFDFDGTIIVSEHVHMRAWEDLSQSVELALPEGFLEGSVGLSDPQLIKILSKAWHHKIPEQEILIKKRGFYMARVPKECSEVPGVVHAIRTIYRARYPLAIATSSSREEVLPVLDRLGIRSCFKSIHTMEDVTHPKPDPEIYRLAATDMGISPEECLAFEDSKAGVESARTAGCILVTVQTLYDAKTLGPALMSVKDFTDPDLLAFLDSLVK